MQLKIADQPSGKHWQHSHTISSDLSPPEVGFYFACIIFVILECGSLRMSARQTGYVWIHAPVGLTAVFACTDKAIAMPVATPIERNLALCALLRRLVDAHSLGYAAARFAKYFKGVGMNSRRRLRALKSLQRPTNSPAC